MIDRRENLVCIVIIVFTLWSMLVCEVLYHAKLLALMRLLNLELRSLHFIIMVS
jgi:hypothetical protein